MTCFDFPPTCTVRKRLRTLYYSMGRHAAAVLRSSTRLARMLPGLAAPRCSLQGSCSWLKAGTSAKAHQASFNSAACPAQESSLSSNSNPSRYASPALELPPHAPMPSPSLRHDRRAKQGSSTARHTQAQEALAKIEATRGVVSPFLRDTFAREHDYLRIRCGAFNASFHEIET